MLHSSERPIYDGSKKGNSKACHYCGKKFRDGQDIEVMPIELKGAHRAYEFVFCLGGGAFHCIRSWRFKYDVFKGANFEVETFCNGYCNTGDSGHELVEL